MCTIISSFVCITEMAGKITTKENVCENGLVFGLTGLLYLLTIIELISNVMLIRDLCSFPKSGDKLDGRTKKGFYYKLLIGAFAIEIWIAMLTSGVNGCVNEK